MRYRVRDLVGENCITLEDGQKVYDAIHPALVAGQDVEVDFAGVQFFASPFFNAAIGQLLRDLKPDLLNSHLKISNLVPTGMEILKRVIANARQYYSDEKSRKAIDEALDQETVEN